jgi:hypothetical protein
MRDAEPHFLPRLYKKLLTLEEATIVRELPAPFEEIAQKLGLTEEQVAQTCKKLVKEGKILQTAKGPRPFNFGTQFADLTLADPARRDRDRNSGIYGGYMISPSAGTEILPQRGRPGKWTAYQGCAQLEGHQGHTWRHAL